MATASPGSVYAPGGEAFLPCEVIFTRGEVLRRIKSMSSVLRDRRRTVLADWVIAGALLGLLGPGSGRGEETGVPLFDGHSLQGFRQHGGIAKYHVEDGQIVGTAVLNTPNSFLCTDRFYRDFILELEFRVDPGLNSGIQVRSRVFDKPTSYRVTDAAGEDRTWVVPAGRVHGYQVEIDPSPRAWTGGIYDEGRRGWLFDLKNNEPARRAFRAGDWNHLRIECVGTSIRTWLNGVLAADLVDAMTREGFIALQVHGIGNNPDNVGKQVRWRNLTIVELPPAP